MPPPGPVNLLREPPDKGHSSTSSAPEPGRDVATRHRPLHTAGIRPQPLLGEWPVPVQSFGKNWRSPSLTGHGVNVDTSSERRAGRPVDLTPNRRHHRRRGRRRVGCRVPAIRSSGSSFRHSAGLFEVGGCALGDIGAGTLLVGTWWVHVGAGTVLTKRASRRPHAMSTVRRSSTPWPVYRSLRVVR